MAMHRWAVVATSIVLAVAPALTYADPGNGKGQGHGKDKGQHSKGHGAAYGGPSINRGDVLGILDGHRNYWSAGAPLPPASRRTGPWQATATGYRQEAGWQAAGAAPSL